MKKIIVFISILLALNSCKEKEEIIPNDQAKISGLIAHKNTDEVQLLGKNFKEKIPVNADGTFSKTIKLKSEGYYTLYDGKNKIPLYLTGGSNINILYDALNTIKLMEFKGKGSETSAFLNNKTKFEQTSDFYNTKKLYALKKEDFDKKMEFFKTEIDKLLANKNIDPKIKERFRQQYDRRLVSMRNSYKNLKFNKPKVTKGQASPTFNFENYKGGTTKLSDLKGNYVYIDVWATWCGPCKQQIPYLKKLEHEFKGKPIKFVSISIDDARRNGGSWDRAKEKWRKFVKDNKLGGIQLFADKGWQSDFIKAYGIRGIPRFILLDKEGKILYPNAPRPSQTTIKNILDNLE